MRRERSRLLAASRVIQAEIAAHAEVVEQLRINPASTAAAVALLENAVEMASGDVFRTAQAEEAKRGMGTTVGGAAGRREQGGAGPCRRQPRLFGPRRTGSPTDRGPHLRPGADQGRHSLGDRAGKLALQERHHAGCRDPALGPGRHPPARYAAGRSLPGCAADGLHGYVRDEELLSTWARVVPSREAGGARQRSRRQGQHHGGGGGAERGAHGHAGRPRDDAGRRGPAPGGPQHAALPAPHLQGADGGAGGSARSRPIRPAREIIQPERRWG